MKKVLVNQLIYRFMRIGLLPLLLITGFYQYDVCPPGTLGRRF